MPSLSIKTPTGTHISPAKLSAKAEAKAAAMKTALTGFGSSSASPCRRHPRSHWTTRMSVLLGESSVSDAT